MGFTGPVGLNIKIIADQAVSVVKNCVTGANKADTHLVNVNPGRDFKINRVENLRYVVEGDTCPKCGEELVISRGIEVGHVFKLGTKYSKALDAKFLDSDGVLKPMLMGCYGIGVNRIIAALIECSHDKDGIIWSPELAPYQVLVLPLNVKDKWCLDAALRIHDELEGAGVETLLDDRDQRPGIKFKDADLIGIPYRVVVGKKYQDVGQVEVQFRGGGEALFVTLDRIVPEIKKLFGS